MTATGIYAVDLNGARCWVNQDDEASEPYGEIRGQYTNNQRACYEQALSLYKEGKREEACQALDRYYEVVTRKF